MCRSMVARVISRSTVTLFVFVFGLAVCTSALGSNSPIDECDKKRKELVELQKLAEETSEYITRSERQLSPSYLLRMPREEIEGNLKSSLENVEKAEKKLAEVEAEAQRKSVNVDPDEEYAFRQGLTYLRAEVDYWTKVMDMKLGSGIDPGIDQFVVRKVGVEDLKKSDGYKNRSAFLKSGRKKLAERRKRIILLQREMKTLKCSEAASSGKNNWTVVQKEADTSKFLQFKWLITRESNGNLMIRQTLVDTNIGFHRQFIGQDSIINARKLSEIKYRIDIRGTDSDPLNRGRFRRRIDCTITDKKINCLGIHKGAMRHYYLSIRGRKFN